MAHQRTGDGNGQASRPHSGTLGSTLSNTGNAASAAQLQQHLQQRQSGAAPGTTPSSFGRGLGTLSQASYQSRTPSTSSSGPQQLSVGAAAAAAAAAAASSRYSTAATQAGFRTGSYASSQSGARQGSGSVANPVSRGTLAGSGARGGSQTKPAPTPPALTPQQQQQQLAIANGGGTVLCNSGELEVDVEFSCRMRQCALRPPTDGGQRLRAASLPAHASHVRTVGAVIPRDRLQEIVAQVDSTERLDPDVEEALMEVAEDFVENVTTFACSLAKHRRSTVVEAQDVQLHLERSWNIVVPGFTASDALKPVKSIRKPNEKHKQRLALIKKAASAARK